MINRIVKFFLDNQLITWLFLLLIVVWGLVTSPFNFNIGVLPHDPVAVDAIPDIGENQQIIFTKWMGRSPQNVEDQITYPLTTYLLGIPGVKSIRSNSMFGFSSISIIFNEDVEFYWSRSRILEKLNALPSNMLPNEVQPSLGPDATALGQVYWYTLEGRDSKGNVTGGWDLDELRSIQDFYVRYGLSSATGVSEVASIGGFVREYQVNVDPDKMRIYDVTLNHVMKALKESNMDVGAQTLEINMVEYFVRGLGYIETISDIEQSVVKIQGNTPIKIKDIAQVSLGPAARRGVLDKSGVEAVGGVVVSRYGSNPMEVINNVKAKVKEISSGLPSKTLEDGTVSKLTIVSFYDRAELIQETLGTLKEALTLELLITIVVILLMLYNIKSSLLVSGVLPIAVLMCFIAMRYFKIDANIVALSGIAIAIGTMVDMGIVLIESIVTQIKKAPKSESLKITIYNATTEVGSAIFTAVTTTVISFLPVFTMQASEGKLFRPLAFTKTFALAASLIIVLTIIPTIAEQVFGLEKRKFIKFWNDRIRIISLLTLSVILLFTSFSTLGIIGLIIGSYSLFCSWYKKSKAELPQYFQTIKYILYVSIIVWFLAEEWRPLGIAHALIFNFLFVAFIIALVMSFFFMIYKYYESLLRFFIKIKYVFLLGVIFLIFIGFQIFKSTGQEFMPSLDEGAFLYMPTSMPHLGMEANATYLRTLDMAVTHIPEVEQVVGKAGRVESALDPAPMSMYENLILYKKEYATDAYGEKIRFKVDDNDAFIRDADGNLIPDAGGQYFRQWRDHIKSPDDIWDEIIKSTQLAGITSAPRLQPIETRLVMLQTGMRAPMGIKVKGSNLKQIETFGLELEKYIKQAKGVKKEAVFADRIIGKPYLLIDINREKIAIYGLSIAEVQKQIQATVGGMVMSTTVENRERYDIRLRYPLELRNSPESISNIYISTANSQQILLGDIADIKYEQGPQSIKSEDTFLTGYVLFDRLEDYAETDVVNNVKSYLQQKIDLGVLKVPLGVSFKFAGNFEQQVRANKRLSVVLPLSLLLIFLILYSQFRSITTSLIIFTGVFVAFSGGFMMIWLYGQPWFMNIDIFGISMRDLFQIKTINLSVAVWVGFLALFGIATDDGVLISTYLQENFKKNPPKTAKEIHESIVFSGLRRVKPALMTTATTVIALLPVLSSSGKGSDIMLPMAIPSFGGMLLQTLTMFTVPVMYCAWKEIQLKYISNSQTVKN